MDEISAIPGTRPADRLDLAIQFGPKSEVALLIMMAGFYVGSVVNVWVALIAFILFAVSLTWLTGTLMIWRGVKKSPDGDG